MPQTSLDEFKLIHRYFETKTPKHPDVVLGISDDAALLSIPSGQLLAAAVDTLVAGVHFPPDTKPEDIAFKSLAVNLSDLAAMGAEPAWFTLALTLPQADEAWYMWFSSGLFELAGRYHMQLAGGDTTRGPLTITIQVHGFVPRKSALLRSGAKAGDKIYVSGTLGDAGAGLLVANGKIKLPDTAASYFLKRLNRPEARVELGILLRDIASSAIDVSDGLLSDLNHILTASNKGAALTTKNLPLSDYLRQHFSEEEILKLALTAGDDYELCFTVSPEHESKLLAKLKESGVPCTAIGVITTERGLHLADTGMQFAHTGYKHF
jgi:thiamine-monophosphate kinase